MLQLTIFLSHYICLGEYGVPMPDKLKIMFLCTGNSCRSQMAEGWTRALKSNLIEAYSAGVDPHGMNERAIRAMHEAGIDITSQHSKHVDELQHIPFDYIITVCDHAHETCPLFPAKTKILHVGFEDPPRLAKTAKTEEEALTHYRRVRDQIKKFVETLPDSISQGSH
jgi:arsenate reductase